MNGQVIIRAKFPQGWRGNHYGQDEKIPATEEQAARLTRAGVAYYDFEPAEEATKHTEKSKLEDIDPNEYVNMSNTKKEIEQFLDKHGYEYSEYMTKSELLDLIE